MTQSLEQALAEIIADAKKLKSHRSDGAAYKKKCDNLVVRIQSVLGNVNAKDLSDEDIKIIKSIKELIITEETFAQSSADLRDRHKWLRYTNE